MDSHECVVISISQLILAAGFYPVTVSYLSLFYTRFEFGRRLSLFYGQAAVGGALGGLLSYAVFSRFGDDVAEGGKEVHSASNTGWKSWQILFFLEGVLTIIVAVIGYFWLPHSAGTAWFLTPDEREYATQRVVRDRSSQSETTDSIGDGMEEGTQTDEESRGLLNPSKRTTTVTSSVTDDRGLVPHDVVSALFSPRIWHILACNILSAVPVYAFQVFLPLVLAPLTETPNPALINLLTTPPYICGAVTLYFFASYSDRHRKRIMPHPSRPRSSPPRPHSRGLPPYIPRLGHPTLSGAECASLRDVHRIATHRRLDLREHAFARETSSSAGDQWLG